MSSLFDVLQDNVQAYLDTLLDEPIEKIGLKKHPFGLDSKIISQQILGKKKAKLKLPTWYSKKNILYPSRTSIEQTSSEHTATYKATLIDGKKMLDATGGFGVDSYYFSKKVHQLYLLESNIDLFDIVAHNFKVLEVENVILLNQDSIDYLTQNDHYFDIIYLDPARRDTENKRVFLLEDCFPNVVEHLDLLLEKSSELLIKTSPLFDLKKGILQLKYVFEIHIIAVENEVKELLWRVSKKKSTEPALFCVSIYNEKINIEKFDFTEKYLPSICLPQKYLFEPNATIMKSGKIDVLAKRYHLNKLHQNTQLLTANNLVNFPGRVFEIYNVISFDKSNMKQHVENKNFIINTRNFHLTVNELRKKWKIKESNQDYLFFTTNAKNEKIILFCKKINF